MEKVIDWRRAAGKVAIFAAALAGSALLAGCKVMTVAQDRALRERRSSDFDANRYVAGIWAGRALEALHAEAVSLPALLAQAQTDLSGAGKAHGRIAGEGAPWTFVVHGEGVIASIDRESRRGQLIVSLDGSNMDGRVVVQIGPFVQGATIRDALPFIQFNDFSDQLVFADIGKALTARALQDVMPSLDLLRPGSRIAFDGAMNLRAATDPIVVTPFHLGAVATGR